MTHTADNTDRQEPHVPETETRTWRGMPIERCAFKIDHLHHVYDDGDGKRVCFGMLAHLSSVGGTGTSGEEQA